MNRRVQAGQAPRMQSRRSNNAPVVVQSGRVETRTVHVSIPVRCVVHAEDVESRDESYRLCKYNKLSSYIVPAYTQSSSFSLLAVARRLIQFWNWSGSR